MQPHTYALYDEVSKKSNKAFEKYTVNYQLVPPNSHQEKKSERAIQTFKDHCKSELATVDPELTIEHCNILLTQAGMALNMLRAIGLNEKISACT